jgi:hypothetical protein
VGDLTGVLEDELDGLALLDVDGPRLERVVDHLHLDRALGRRLIPGAVVFAAHGLVVVVTPARSEKEDRHRDDRKQGSRGLHGFPFGEGDYDCTSPGETTT